MHLKDVNKNIKEKLGQIFYKIINKVRLHSSDSVEVISVDNLTIEWIKQQINNRLHKGDVCKVAFADCCKVIDSYMEQVHEDEVSEDELMFFKDEQYCMADIDKDGNIGNYAMIRTDNIDSRLLKALNEQDGMLVVEK